MALSKKTAQAIVAAVDKDAESRKRLTSKLGGVLPENWGITGAIRNWGLMLSGQDPTEKETADIVCTGIADATEIAIKTAKIPEVSEVGIVSRVHRGTHHTATFIKTKDSGEYVFDWHATLNPLNPFIFTKELWMEDKAGVMFIEFNGL